MSIELWDGRGAVLADTSAWMRARRIPRARELLFAAAERGELAWCWPVRYELTFDAPNPERIAAVDRTLEGLREIAVDRAVQRDVISAMRELADEGFHGAALNAGGGCVQRSGGTRPKMGASNWFSR